MHPPYITCDDDADLWHECHARGGGRSPGFMPIKEHASRQVHIATRDRYGLESAIGRAVQRLPQHCLQDRSTKGVVFETKRIQDNQVHIAGTVVKVA